MSSTPPYGTRRVEKNGKDQAQDRELRELNKKLDHITGELQTSRAVFRVVVGIAIVLWSGLVALFGWQTTQIVDLRSAVTKNGVLYDIMRETLGDARHELKDCRDLLRRHTKNGD